MPSSSSSVLKEMSYERESEAALFQQNLVSQGKRRTDSTRIMSVQRVSKHSFAEDVLTRNQEVYIGN
jgi:hypothetical protein